MKNKNKYVIVPKIVSYKDIITKNYTLSPAQYERLEMPNQNYMFVRDFLTRELERRIDLGCEVGSKNYVDKSPYKFLRTRALQKYSFLPQVTSKTALSIKPYSFVPMNLKEGDLLISKDSNIGEIVILDKDYPKTMLSGAIYKLPIKEEQKYYLLAFIKHPIFREQLDALAPKGATIRHAKQLFLECKIPLPNTKVAETIKYVECLTKAIINKEKLIKQRHQNILKSIEDELLNNQKPKKFKFEYPTFKELLLNNRFDATFYSKKHKQIVFATKNYLNGFGTLDKQGFYLKPGPSLEIRLLGTRIDSNCYLAGFYRLITPKQILNYGTLKQYDYIGTPITIPKIKFGDILFGESGTGRTMVYLENDNNSINNAHAHILRPIKDKCSLEKAITIRSILQYYKEIGLIDCLTVGGSGGHLSPSYFDRIYIPNFPEEKQKEIAKLYYNEKSAYEVEKISLDTFEQYENTFNAEAGIYNLDKYAKKLKERLDIVIDQIVNDKEVEFDFNFLC